MRIAVLAALMTMGLGGIALPQSAPLLQLSGQPYSAGSMTLHFIATPGQPTLLFYGLDPLELPLQTTKGPFYVGTIFNTLPLGAIPALGRIDVTFVLPPLSPVLAGIPLVMQGFVPGALTNPATLPLDQPYYVPADATILTSPNAQELGLFGDTVATGDLNGDGEIDIAVSAWWEDAAGVDLSGRVYVFWGPSLGTTTTLEPPIPVQHANFGMGLAIGDLNDDGIDDLIVAEGTTDPPPSDGHGHLYLFNGGRSFSTVPTGTVTSSGSGSAYSSFGRCMSVADFNGDGDPDIAIGVPRVMIQGLANAGQVEIYWGPSLAAVSILTAPDLTASGFFGDRLGTGDVSGDGIVDLIVGAPRKMLGGLVAMGRVYAFVGPALAHFKTIDHPLPAGTNSRFGNAVLGEDLDGDGVDEVISTDQRNHAFIFWSPSLESHLLVTRPPDPVTGTATSTSFGYFSTTGDVNGDALIDVIISEPFAASQGRVYAAIAPYFSDFHVLVDKVPENLAEFGWGVLMRDVDGDGRLELLVGSDTADPNGLASSGRLTVFDFDQ